MWAEPKYLYSSCWAKSVLTRGVPRPGAEPEGGMPWTVLGIVLGARAGSGRRPF